MAVLVDIDAPKNCLSCPMHNNSNDYCKAKHEFASLVRAKNGCPIREANSDLIIRDFMETAGALYMAEQISESAYDSLIDVIRKRGGDK